MAYEDFINFPRRTAADKVLRDKVFNFAKNRKYDEHQHGPASMFYNFLIKSLLVLLLFKTNN